MKRKANAHERRLEERRKAFDALKEKDGRKRPGSLKK